MRWHGVTFDGKVGPLHEIGVSDERRWLERSAYSKVGNSRTGMIVSEATRDMAKPADGSRVKGAGGGVKGKVGLRMSIKFGPVTVRHE